MFGQVDDHQEFIDEPRIVEDPAVWLADGNIVVAAGSDPTYLFRCHKSVLSKHSDVFEGMLTLPPSEAVETYGGLPLVHLSDSSDDVRALLSVLYDPSLVPKDTYTPTNMAKISGPLRLAKKYQIETLFFSLADILRRDWPTTYGEWQRMQDAMYGQLPSPEKMEEAGVLRYADYFPDPVPVIRSALDVGLDEILPAAYYELHKWYPEGIEPTWGSQFDELFEISYEPVPISDSALTSEELRHFFLAADAFDGTARDAFEYFRLLDVHQWSCEKSPQGLDAMPEKDPCSGSLILFADARLTKLRLMARCFPRDPIDTFRLLEAELCGFHRTNGFERCPPTPLDTWISERICGSCCRRLSRVVALRREALWENMRSCFSKDTA